MSAHGRRTAIFTAIRGVPWWMWPVWAGGIVVLISLISLLFFTSDAPPRAVIVNDTAAPLHVFYCTDRKCLHGDSGTDEVLESRQTTTDFWMYPDDDGLIGVATIPAKRLTGCLSDPHAGRDVPHAYAVLASAARPCPGQAPASYPVVSLDGQ
jgi:hypothetical protein